MGEYASEGEEQKDYLKMLSYINLEKEHYTTRTINILNRINRFAGSRAYVMGLVSI